MIKEGQIYHVDFIPHSGMDRERKPYVPLKGCALVKVDKYDPDFRSDGCFDARLITACDDWPNGLRQSCAFNEKFARLVTPEEEPAYAAAIALTGFCCRCGKEK